MIVPSKASRGGSGKFQSALLTRLQQEGFDSSIELPFTCEELSCWLVKDAAASLQPDELITAIKVCIFADWTTPAALCSPHALFISLLSSKCSAS